MSSVRLLYLFDVTKEAAIIHPIKISHQSRQKDMNDYLKKRELIKDTDADSWMYFSIDDSKDLEHQILKHIADVKEPIIIEYNFESFLHQATHQPKSIESYFKELKSK